MAECRNPEMKDRLPELAARGGAAGDADVRQHVSTCESCRAELAVIEQVRGARMAGGRMDTARIVAGVGPYRSRPLWRRVAASGQFRAAAAVVLVAGGIAVGYAGREPSAVDSVLAQASPGARPMLAIGDNFADLSDADLRELAAELGQLQAVTPTETEVLDVPAVVAGTGSGGSA